MITTEQERHIVEHAFVPEHLVCLMTGVSGGEPFLMDDCLCLLVRDVVIVVGYPLGREHDPNRLTGLLHHVMESLKPARISLIAPNLPDNLPGVLRERQADHYYTLDPGRHSVRANLLKKVSQARDLVRVDTSRVFSNAHHELSHEFAERAGLPPDVRELLFRMPHYLEKCEQSAVLSAWTSDNRLAAFYVADLSNPRFSTYIIGCHSKKNYVPAASDLLLYELIDLSRNLGNSQVHLGLGVNPGIRQFKKKWGGIPSIPYEMCELRLRRPSFADSILGL